jgi:hypothetical protein
MSSPYIKSLVGLSFIQTSENIAVSLLSPSVYPNNRVYVFLERKSSLWPIRQSIVEIHLTPKPPERLVISRAPSVH